MHSMFYSVDLRPKILCSSVTLFFVPRFTTPHHKEGFELFLDTITEMEDVWLVTSWQAIQWMRSAQPVQLSFLKRKYFQKSHNSGQDPRLQTLRM